MKTPFERLHSALKLFAEHRTPAKARDALRRKGLDTPSTFDGATPTEIEGHAADLERRGFDVVFEGDQSFPSQLSNLKSPPPPAILFTWGNTNLLGQPAVGMCGSRHASPEGLAAARSCGQRVASQGLVVVSGYARGVDTETHLGALESGGATIIVLAEGIEHFRHKKAFSSTGLPADRTCVVSQFPPKQSWTAGGAMTRNGTIVGLSKALVVVEAGEKGGTLNAGLTGLKAERPVLALEYGTRPTPTGNRVLIDKGAMPVKSTDELSRVLQQIGEQAQSPATQLQLLRPTLSDEAADSTA